MVVMMMVMVMLTVMMVMGALSNVYHFRWFVSNNSKYYEGKWKHSFYHFLAVINIMF